MKAIISVTIVMVLGTRGFSGGLSDHREHTSSEASTEARHIYDQIGNKTLSFEAFELDAGQVLYQEYVTHGKNTGNLIAEKFSDIPHSNQSSLGFYKTAETYFGKHGLSLRLDGLEKGINDKARQRAIVIHSAKYAEASFI